MGVEIDAGQSKFTPERQETILIALRAGHSLKRAAKKAGVYHETVKTWRLRHAWFDEAVTDAIRGGPRRITRAVFDATVAAMRSGSTGTEAAKCAGATYSGVLYWAERNGLEDEFEDAAAIARRARPRSEAKPKRRRLSRVEKVDRDMTDEVIAAVAARVREARGVQSNGLNTVEAAVVAALGRRPAAFYAWREAYPERAAPIAEAVAWVRDVAPREWALSLLAPEVRQAMLDAVERGCGWNGIAKAAGTYDTKLKKWCAPPFVNAEHEQFVGELLSAWKTERACRAAGDPIAIADLTASAHAAAAVKRTRKARDARMRTEYGITLVQAEAMLDRQGGCCPVCLSKLRPIGERQDPKADARSRPVVDHCHDTGAVRGVLCAACNAGIGMLGDTVDAARRAAEYLATAPGRAASIEGPKRCSAPILVPAMPPRSERTPASLDEWRAALKEAARKREGRGRARGVPGLSVSAR